MSEVLSESLVSFSGVLVEPDPVPQDMAAAFAEFLEIDVAHGDATDDTVQSYLNTVALFLKWCFERDLDPINAKRADIERYRADLKAAGNTVSTRSRKLSIVRRFYEAALKHNLVQQNPAANVRGGKDLTPPEEKMKPLTRRALQEMFAAIPASTLLGRRDRVIVALMAVHGLRRVEVHRLDHENLDLTGEAAAFRVTGKGNKIRRVYLRKDTQAALTQYLEAKTAAGLELTGALIVSGSNETRGQRISRRGLNWVVDSYLTGLSLKQEGISCHALRHTHGTLAVAGGAKVEQLREEMGHGHIETTSIYVRALERVKQNPAHFIDVDV